jgi:hypothetical protein
VTDPTPEVTDETAVQIREEFSREYPQYWMRPSFVQLGRKYGIPARKVGKIIKGATQTAPP